MLEEKLVLLPHVCGQVVHRSHISTMELRSHFQEGNAGGDCTLHCIQCGEEALTERLVFVRQHASLFRCQCWALRQRAGLFCIRRCLGIPYGNLNGHKLLVAIAKDR